MEFWSSSLRMVCGDAESAVFEFFLGGTNCPVGQASKATFTSHSGQEASPQLPLTQAPKKSPSAFLK